MQQLGTNRLHPEAIHFGRNLGTACEVAARALPATAHLKTGPMYGNQPYRKLSSFQRIVVGVGLAFTRLYSRHNSAGWPIWESDAIGRRG